MGQINDFTLHILQIVKIYKILSHLMPHSIRVPFIKTCSIQGLPKE